MDLQPTRSLPDGYAPGYEIDLGRNVSLMLLLNVAGLVILAVSGVLFGAALNVLRPNEMQQLTTVEFSGGGEALGFVAQMIAVTVAMLVLHEAAHGLFFYIFTGERPRFGLGAGFAYAAAPGWYLPKCHYVVVGLAPLVLLSLLGLLLMLVVPPGWFLAVMLLVCFNAAGAVGDLWVVLRLLFEPATTLVEDKGAGMRFYVLRERR